MNFDKKKIDNLRDSKYIHKNKQKNRYIYFVRLNRISLPLQFSLDLKKYELQFGSLV